ncbi:ATP-binding protein [Nonomuraea jiangxiensis]|uniref:Anti-sigma regulatory factor (Ser/Thr protein kinase) n=1 Tax=Nonomuraea jiangxiensis TaxID=633440 RepID=A0A1G8X3A4_9ACTN|nr:ATP-binding protein [Nonomuraea jiangxiensis]SDJ84325.1 Anti-sigma regulatory factor (Ser/Thr protein kinase) [Nonomuraea jiangxiensis]
MNEDVEPQSGYTSPPPGVPVKQLSFRLPGLPLVRQFAEDEARAAGIPEESIGDFVIAVNEVATNAVTHGADDASIRAWTIDGDLVVEIHDHGTWKPGPMPGAVGGMGLWVARLLSSDLTLRVGRGGSTVIMRFPGKG